jgi:hypothetical protein
MARKKGKSTELSVFKGREAKLNRAIFQNLALKGPQTIYDLHKNMKLTRGLKQSHYANVNKRTRALEQRGYLRMVNILNTKAGFKASVYEMKAKAYLALVLDKVNLEELLDQTDEEVATVIVAIVAGLIL